MEERKFKETSIIKNKTLRWMRESSMPMTSTQAQPTDPNQNNDSPTQHPGNQAIEQQQQQHELTC